MTMTRERGKQCMDVCECREEVFEQSCARARVRVHVLACVCVCVDECLCVFVCAFCVCVYGHDIHIFSMFHHI